MALLGIVGNVPLVGPLLVINCSPITVIGLNVGTTCTQQALCCQSTQLVSVPYTTIVEEPSLMRCTEWPCQRWLLERQPRWFVKVNRGSCGTSRACPR